MFVLFCWFFPPLVSHKTSPTKPRTLKKKSDVSDISGLNFRVQTSSQSGFYSKPNNVLLDIPRKLPPTPSPGWGGRNDGMTQSFTTRAFSDAQMKPLHWTCWLNKLQSAPLESTAQGRLILPRRAEAQVFSRRFGQSQRKTDGPSAAALSSGLERNWSAEWAHAGNQSAGFFFPLSLIFLPSPPPPSTGRKEICWDQPTLKHATSTLNALFTCPIITTCKKLINHLTGL